MDVLSRYCVRWFDYLQYMEGCWNSATRSIYFRTLTAHAIFRALEISARAPTAGRITIHTTSGGTQIQAVTLQQSGGVPTNRIATVNTVNYSYDAAGNLTNDGAHAYSYDAENRLASVDGGSAGQYSYDHRNWRVKKVVGSASTHYVWEGAQVIAEHNGSTGAVQVEYVYAGSRLVAKETGGSRQYVLSDRLSVRMILDASGNMIGRQGHLPFGEDFAESGSQHKHHFTSYERDAESGLDYAVNRFYASSIGRFLQADPYG